MTRVTCNGEVVYLAGKMTGLPYGGKTAFDRAAGRLREVGFVVISPIELDEAVNISLAAEPTDWDWTHALARDLAVISVVHGVVYIPHLIEASRGAYLELTTARARGIPVVTVDQATEKGTIYVR